MAKSKSTKTTTRKRTRKKTKSRSKKPKIKANVIWLYAADTRLILRALSRILNYGAPKALQFREQFDISLELSMIPLYPYPASPRVDMLKELSKIEGAVILVVGLTSDQKNKQIQKYYKEATGIWLHPFERQFHEDMMGAKRTLEFHQAEERFQEWKPYMEKHFDNFNIVRNV